MLKDLITSVNGNQRDRVAFVVTDEAANMKAARQQLVSTPGFTCAVLCNFTAHNSTNTGILLHLADHAEDTYALHFCNVGTFWSSAA